MPAALLNADILKDTQSNQVTVKVANVLI
jgi:hypothetical protein